MAGSDTSITPMARTKHVVMQCNCGEMSATDMQVKSKSIMKNALLSPMPNPVPYPKPKEFTTHLAADKSQPAQPQLLKKTGLFLS